MPDRFRAILIVTGITFFVMAYIGFNLPKDVKFNFDAFYTNKEYFPFFLIAGSLLVMFSSIRLQRFAMISGAEILLTLGLVFIFEKLTGSNIGSFAWVVMLFGMLILLIHEYPSGKYSLTEFIIFIFIGIYIFPYIVNRSPNIHYMLESLAKHENPIKRLEILHLLQEVNEPRIIDPLISILRNSNKSDYIRSAAVGALGDATLNLRSVKPLAKMVQDKQCYHIP